MDIVHEVDKERVEFTEKQAIRRIPGKFFTNDRYCDFPVHYGSSDLAGTWRLSFLKRSGMKRPRHEWKRIQELLEKADRSLKAVERLRQSEDNDFAISRAYYAMFYYVVQALLLRGDHRRNKHSGVIAALTIFRKNRQAFFTFFILLRMDLKMEQRKITGLRPFHQIKGVLGISVA